MQDNGIRAHPWNLNETDDHFQCTSEQEFSKLKPLKPIEPVVPYDKVRPPESDPPNHVLQRERCATAIYLWFVQLQYRKISLDNQGCNWPEDGSHWVPRYLHDYEQYLYNGYRVLPSVPWKVFGALKHTSEKLYPHQVYYSWHADEGIDGVISRSEVKIFVTVMQGRMMEATYCMHNPPVSPELISPSLL